jgi:hypothetical protein
MFIKGIKKGKTIELLEEIDFPDGQELFLEIKKSNDFWSSLQDFRLSVSLSDIDNIDLHDLRDNSVGRDVNL